MPIIKKLIFTIITSLIIFFPTPGTAYHNSYPPFVRKPPQPTLKLDVPFHKQEHKLSCEVATLRMLLLNRKIDEPENWIIDKMPFGEMGADPDQVFVGEIDGVQFRTGYGIHAKGLEKVADFYGGAQSFENQNLGFLLDRLHDGNPIIIWGSFLGAPREAAWTTPAGKLVKAYRGEHTYVVTGYAGPRQAPTHIFTLDPINGERVFRTDDFLRNWGWYNNSGLFLE